MTKHLVFVLSVCFLLISCQKELGFENIPGSTYYIKFNVDGSPRQYTYGAAAFTETDILGNKLSFIAFASSSVDNLESILLNIYYDATAPDVNTYTEIGSPDFFTLGAYDPNSPATVYTAGIASPTVQPLTITIKTKTDTEISGTFDGAFYKTDKEDGEVHDEPVIISEGEFRLPLK